MTALLITYDLNKPGQNYDDLYENIKGLGAWWHYLDSTWIVKTTLSPVEAFERLRASLDESDNMLIFDVTGAARQGWLSKPAWDWIHENVRRSPCCASRIETGRGERWCDLMARADAPSPRGGTDVF